nr:reverse transcriptase domain-containing protein [Tanacetum cinerariifolium]
MYLLEKQKEVVLKSGKLSDLIKELKQFSGKEQPKAAKKGETSVKDKSFAIIMRKEEVIASIACTWMADQPQRYYMNTVSTDTAQTKNQLVPAITSLIRFSGEIIWPIGQIQLLVRIGDEEHSASTRMNFVVVRSPSPYNGIIGRPRVRKLLAVSLTAHEMLKLR